MRTKLAHCAIALLAVTAATGVALAAPRTPKAGSFYFSKKPNVSITVGKRAKYVTLFVSCFTSPGVGDDWTSGKIPFKKDTFKFDRKTKIGSENNTKFGIYKATILVTGTYKHGKFAGTMQIGGSSCAKASYTAKRSKGGGSGH
jgi:hypothetical protein